MAVPGVVRERRANLARCRDAGCGCGCRDAGCGCGCRDAGCWLPSHVCCRRSTGVLCSANGGAGIPMGPRSLSPCTVGGGTMLTLRVSLVPAPQEGRCLPWRLTCLGSGPHHLRLTLGARPSTRRRWSGCSPGLMVHRDRWSSSGTRSVVGSACASLRLGRISSPASPCAARRSDRAYGRGPGLPGGSGLSVGCVGSAGWGKAPWSAPGNGMARPTIAPLPG